MLKRWCFSGEAQRALLFPVDAHVGDGAAVSSPVAVAARTVQPEWVEPTVERPAAIKNANRIFFIIYVIYG